MTTIYLGQGVRIASYSSSSRNEKSTVKVELVVSDPYDLGSLLRELADAKKEQEAALKAASKPARKPKPAPAAPQLALPAPPRQLAYYPEEHD